MASLSLMNCQLTDEEKDELRFQAERENIARKVTQEVTQKEMKNTFDLP